MKKTFLTQNTFLKKLFLIIPFLNDDNNKNNNNNDTTIGRFLKSEEKNLIREA